MLAFTSLSLPLLCVLVNDVLADPEDIIERVREYARFGKRREPNNVQCFKNSDCISDCCISSTSDPRSGICVGKPHVGQICGLLMGQNENGPVGRPPIGGSGAQMGQPQAPQQLQQQQHLMPGGNRLGQMMGNGQQQDNRLLNLQQLLSMVHQNQQNNNMLGGGGGNNAAAVAGAAADPGAIMAMQQQNPGFNPSYGYATAYQSPQQQGGQQQQQQNGFVQNFSPTASNFLQSLGPASGFNYG